MTVMGQSQSTRQSRADSYSCSGRTWRGKRRNKHRGGGGSELSATFHVVADMDVHFEQLNINQATEEELMTLPGISRTEAKNIVEYRQLIGSFNKVEDIALVSGVGATKLQSIRPEICVSHHHHRRRIPSNQDSLDSVDVEMSPKVTSSRLPVTVDVNAANVFQLMAVRGISQSLAANIVHYREKKGGFKSIDDLVKVKGMNYHLLRQLRIHFTLNSDNSNSSQVVNRNKIKRKSSSENCLDRIGRIGFIKQDAQVSFDPLEIYELLAAKSPRPILYERFGFERHGRKALRLASWNLSQLTSDKAHNFGVMEVICRTIMENGFSLIAFQELGDCEVLEKLCSELNNPCLKRNRDWGGHRGTWDSVSSPVSTNNNQCIGFLFDTSQNIGLKESEFVLTSYPLAGSLMWATFTVGEFELTMSSTVLSANNPAVLNGNSHVGSNGQLVLDDRLTDKLKHVVIMGDFKQSSKESHFDCYRKRGFKSLVPENQTTGSNPKPLTGQQDFYDNIWISNLLQQAFTGEWGIVRLGLSHLAIPNGWSWGGMVSEHCPVWSEFYVANSNGHNSNHHPIANGKASPV